MRQRPRSAERICARRRTRTPRSGRTCVGDRSCLLVAFLFVIQVHTRHQTVNCTVKRCIGASAGLSQVGTDRFLQPSRARHATPREVRPLFRHYRSESASVVRYPQTDERSSVAERATAPCWNLPIDTPEVSRTAPVTPSRACDHSAPMAYPRPPPRCSPHAPRSRSARRNARNRPAGRVPASADRDGSRRIRKAPETVV